MILDYLFVTGQAACAMLLLYGAFLVLIPARKQAPAALPKHEMVLAKS